MRSSYHNKWFHSYNGPCSFCKTFTGHCVTYWFQMKMWYCISFALWRLVCEASFLPQNCRSSRPEVFCKKGVLRNLAKLTGKHLCQSLFFNKAAGKRLCQKCLPVNFAKFLGTSFLKEHLMWQLMHLISCQSILSSFLAFFPIIAVQEDDTLHTNNNNHRNLLGLFHNSLINWLVGMGKWINCRNYCI